LVHCGLVFPTDQGHAVNMLVPSHSYVKTPFTLELLTVDTNLQLLNIVGSNVQFSRGLGCSGNYMWILLKLSTLVCLGGSPTMSTPLCKGNFVLNYIDNIIGNPTSDVTNSHFQLILLSINWVLINLIPKLSLPLHSDSFVSVFLSISKLGYFKFLLLSYRKLFLSVTFTFLNLKLLKGKFRLYLAPLCFYTRPLSLLGYLSTTSWLYSETWALRLQWLSMRSPIRTSYVYWVFSGC
jgi:hypothetical protein